METESQCHSECKLPACFMLWITVIKQATKIQSPRGVTVSDQMLIMNILQLWKKYSSLNAMLKY